MVLKCWRTSLLAVSLSVACAGCAFPGRPNASLGQPQSSRWNPFSTPTATYQQQTENEEEELPSKKITDPNPLKLRYALWMEETGNYPEARKHFSEVLAARPKELEAVLGVARVDLATGNTDQAEQGFRRALKLDDQSALAHSGLGQCLFARQDWPAAVEELTDASQGLPEDKTIRYHLAMALVHSGQLAAAQIQFSHCVGEAAGHYNTALILKDQGDMRGAEVQLELALRKDPKLKDAERWLTELRQVRASQEQVSLQGLHGPAEITPPVKQVTYKDYGPVGTVEIEPALFESEDAGPVMQHAGGHSLARP